jgi:hypothetical protein
MEHLQYVVVGTYVRVCTGWVRTRTRRKSIGAETVLGDSL